MGEEIAVETPSEDSAFAAGVTEFGMLLRDSQYKGTASYGGIVGRLSRLPGVAEDGYKAEFLELVRGRLEQ